MRSYGDTLAGIQAPVDRRVSRASSLDLIAVLAGGVGITARLIIDLIRGGPSSGAVAQWRPEFFDYLYLSFTNPTAFRPTVVMPLAR